MSIKLVQSQLHSMSPIVLVINLMVALIAPVNSLNHHDGVGSPPIPQTDKLSGLILPGGGESTRDASKQNQQAPRIFFLISPRSLKGITATLSSSTPLEVTTCSSSSPSDEPPLSTMESSTAPASSPMKIESVTDQLPRALIKTDSKGASVNKLDERAILKVDSNETTNARADDKSKKPVMSWLNKHFAIVPSSSYTINWADKAATTSKQKDKIEPVASSDLLGANKATTDERSQSKSSPEIVHRNSLDQRATDTTAAILNELRNDEKSDRLSDGGTKLTPLIKKHMRLISNLGDEKLFNGQKRDGCSSKSCDAQPVVEEPKKLIASTFAANHFSQTNWRRMSPDHFAHLLQRFNFAINSTQFHDVEDLLKSRETNSLRLEPRKPMQFMHFG